MINCSPKQIAAALGGEVSGSEVLAPGPGHSPKDRSLSIKIDPGAPDGFVVYSFAGDDPLKCKDYVRDRAGLGRWEPTRPPKVDNVSRMADRVRKPVAKAGSAPATYISSKLTAGPTCGLFGPASINNIGTARLGSMAHRRGPRSLIACLRSSRPVVMA